MTVTPKPSIFEALGAPAETLQWIGQPREGVYFDPADLAHWQCALTHDRALFVVNGTLPEKYELHLPSLHLINTPMSLQTAERFSFRSAIFSSWVYV